jgi:SAM-dependent methyltransferase
MIAGRSGDSFPDGPAFYDNPVVFTNYRETDVGPDRPKPALELPDVLDLIAPDAGPRVVDLGCGDAAIAPELAARGCTAYLGLDGSQRMVEAARVTTAGMSGVEIRRQRIEEYRGVPGSAELVLSRLALHYVEDIVDPLRQGAIALLPGGRLVFSVEHPLVTASDPRATTDHPRGAWVVDRYFERGARESEWLGGRVRKYHRTIGDHVAAVARAGLALEALREGDPRRDRFTGTAEYERRRRIPLFLIIAARRP